MTERLGGTVDAVQLGRAIAAARTERGIKRAQLATAAQVSYPYLSELENGSKHGSTRKITQIAEALGMSPSQLLARAESLARGDSSDSTGDGRTPGPGAQPSGGVAEPSGDAIAGSQYEDSDRPRVSLRPLGPIGERTEDLIVERVTQAVRDEIEKWLDAELEPAVRAEVRAALSRPDQTR